MAFWKKSDDPWDRKPGKRTTNWYENEMTSAETPTTEGSVGAATGRPPEERELTPEEQRIRDIIEGPKARPVEVEKCPWCGGDMKAVSIYSGGASVLYWQEGEPSGARSWMDANVLEDGGGLWGPSYKVGSYCESCEKMVLSVKKPRTSPAYNDPNSFEDYARQWKEREQREKEEERRKKRGD